MRAIHATWINGKIVPDEPVDWPEGCRLTVDAAPGLSFAGMSDDEQDSSPEAIAKWIAEFDAIPPVQMTSEEYSRWQSIRNEQGNFELANFDENAAKLQRMWE
jgi:hypothetical protein